MRIQIKKNYIALTQENGVTVKMSHLSFLKTCLQTLAGLDEQEMEETAEVAKIYKAMGAVKRINRNNGLKLFVYSSKNIANLEKMVATGDATILLARSLVDAVKEAGGVGVQIRTLNIPAA